MLLFISPEVKGHRVARITEHTRWARHHAKLFAAINSPNPHTKREIGAVMTFVYRGETEAQSS